MDQNIYMALEQKGKIVLETGICYLNLGRKKQGQKVVHKNVS